MADTRATLARNLAGLAREQPALAEALTVCGPHPALAFVSARDGSTSLQSGGPRIHTAYAPQRRAAAEIDGNAALVVCIGAGALYRARAALAARGDSSVVVIEPSLPALHSALAARSFEPRDWKRLTLVTDAAQVAAYVARWYQPALTPGSQVLELNAWIEQSGHGEAFDRMRAALVRTLAAAEADAAAFARFGRAWLVNSVHHSFRLSRSAALWRSLAAELARTAAVALGAGPSLETATTHGARLSTDTALPFVRRAIGAPAACVSLDPQAWTAGHLRAVPAPLIAELGGPAARYATRTALFTTGHPLHRLLVAAGAPLPVVPPTTSVSVAAIEVAQLLGCREVTTAGIDGYYPRGATYVRGTYHHHLAARRASRICPREHRFTAAVYAHARRVPGGYQLPGAETARRAVDTALQTPRVTDRLDRSFGSGVDFDPATFWSDHVRELEAAVRRLEGTTGMTTPQLLHAAGPHAIAQIPFHAAAVRGGRATTLAGSLHICRTFLADVLDRYCT